MKFRHIFNIAAGMVLVAILFVGCKKSEPPPGRSGTAKMDSGINYVILESPDLERLDLQQKTLAYYLTAAAACGDPIVYQQLHPEALKIKGFLDGIFSQPMGIKPYLIKAMRGYGQSFYANHGVRNLYTGEKIIPSVDIHRFNEAVLVATSNGARVGYVSHREIWETFLELESVIYDPSEKGDEWRTADDAVIRAGNDTLSGGLFAKELSGVADNLRRALEYADPANRENLEKLERYLETGSYEDYQQYLSSWMENNSEVEISIGYTEYNNLYYGLVYIGNAAYQERVNKILKIASDIINNRTIGSTLSSFKVLSADLLSAYGIYGYSPPEAISECGDTGAKIVLFPNVVNAVLGNKTSLQKELCVSEEDYSAVTTCLDEYAIIRAISSERINSLICGSKNEEKNLTLSNSVLKEALVLQVLIDDRFAKVGIYPDNITMKTIVEIWIRECLAQISSPCKNCPVKSKKYLIDYFISKNAISSVKIAGKTYFNMEDEEVFRRALTSLLNDLDQNENNLTEIPDDIGLNKKVIQEISGRLKTAGLSEHEYVLTPKVNLKTTRMGKVKDVMVTVPEDIIDLAVDTAMKSSK